MGCPELDFRYFDEDNVFIENNIEILKKTPKKCRSKLCSVKYHQNLVVFRRPHVLKDPVNAIDPEGKFLVPILAFGVAGAVGAGYGAYLSGASRSGIFKSVLIGFAGGALGGLGGATVVGAIAGGFASGIFAGFSASADVVKPPTPISEPECSKERLP